MAPRKFRWSIDGGANWTEEEEELPFNIGSVTVGDTVIVEAIGEAVTAEGDQVQAFFGSLDNIYALHALRLCIPDYEGPLVRLRRSTDNVEADFDAGGNAWADGSAISSWLGGASGYVARLYDQTGNGRHAEQATADLQPIVDLSGARPFVDSVNKWLAVQNAAGFGKNISAASLLSVRRHKIAPLERNRTVIQVSSGTAASAIRMALRLASESTDQIRGRRVDGGTLDGPTGFTPNLDWATQIGRYDYATGMAYHRRDDETETDSSFASTGSTSNTDNAGFTYGNHYYDPLDPPASTAPAEINYTLMASFTDLLTDEEDEDAATVLEALKP